MEMNKGLYWKVAAFMACLICMGAVPRCEARERIEIRTLEELQNTEGDFLHHYVLVNDIDASATRDWNDGKGFLPIDLSGHFDGQGNKITGLYINRPTEIVGLFGKVAAGARIDNVRLENINIWGVQYAGGLAGYNEGIISKSYAGGKVEAERGYAGGLIGINTGHVKESFSRGSVSANSMAGGLVGSNLNGLIYDSYSTSDVSSKEDRPGVAGLVGGIAGENRGSITECYSTGRVQSANDWPPGGLVGRNTGPVLNSFWDRESSGVEGSDGGEGKTTREMMTKSTFTDSGMWNFNDIWIIHEGESYPMLRWQIGVAPIPMPDVPLPIPEIPDTPDVPTVPVPRPQPPENLRAEPGNMEVILFWDESPSTGIGSYRVYVRVPESVFKFQASVPADITEYRHHGLTNNVTYIYAVRSLRYGLESKESSNFASAVPGTDEADEGEPPSPDELPPPEGEVPDEEGDDSSDCFIATATYGSFMSSELMSLRAFRDGFLLVNTAGRTFINAYYRISPAFAEAVQENSMIRLIARLHLTPMVRVVNLVLDMK